MSRCFVVLVKDVVELLATGRAILLAIVLPCVFLYLVGQLRTQPIEARVLLVGAGKAGTQERAAADASAAALNELTMFRVDVDERVPDQMEVRLAQGDYDLLAVQDQKSWLLYTASTDPFRLAVLQQVAPRVKDTLDQANLSSEGARVQPPIATALERVRSSLLGVSSVARRWEQGQEPQLNLTAAEFRQERAKRGEVLDGHLRIARSELDGVLSIRPDAFVWRTARARVEQLEGQLIALQHIAAASLSRAERQQLAGLANEATDVARSISYDGPSDAPPRISPPELMTAAVSLPSGALRPLHPVAAERPRALLPEIAALILCVLPFVLSCHSLVREREERTLDVLLAVPRMTPATIIGAKSGSAVVITLAVCLCLVVVMHAAYGLFVKTGLSAMLVFGVIPAATAAALLGLAVSAWTNSSLQATIASAIYLLVQSLVGGFLYPVSAGTTDVISLLAMAFPLTFVGPAMRTWALGSTPDWSAVAVSLGVMCVGYALVARLALRQLVRRL